MGSVGWILLKYIHDLCRKKDATILCKMCISNNAEKCDEKKVITAGGCSTKCNHPNCVNGKGSFWNKIMYK